MAEFNCLTHRFSLDVNDTAAQVSLACKRGDTGIQLRIILTDNGIPYEITPGSAAVFTATKPDGTNLYNYCRIEGNTVVYDFTEQTVNVPGQVDVELRLTYGGMVLTSPSFIIIVDETIYDDLVPTSSNEATALTELIGKSEAAVTACESATTYATQSASAAEKSAHEADLAADNARGVAQTVQDMLDSGEFQGETTLPIARGTSADGIAYTATGDGLPTVQTGSHDTQTDPVGKGRQIVFVPMLTNNTIAPTLKLNGGEVIPIRMRAPKNQGSNDQSPDAKLPVPAGALMRGVPYTLTFCGKYWLVDSAIGGGNAELVELTQPVTISNTECNNVQEALEAAADALVGKIDEVDVEEVPFVTASNAIQKVANDTAPITPAGVKRIVDEYGVNAQNIVEIVQTEIDRLCPEPVQLTMLPNKPAYYTRMIRGFSAQKQYAKFDYCYRMPDNDTYTHFYYCKVNSGHLGDWSDADFTDLGRVIDPTLDPALAAVNWTEYIPAAERGTLKLYANNRIYGQSFKHNANSQEIFFSLSDQMASSWLNIKFDVDGALSGCEYQAFGFASAD